jgi:outer membrane protein TolC
MKDFGPIIFAALFLAGCATFQPQPISPEKLAAQFGSRSLEDDGLRAFVKTNLGRGFKEWPPKNWNLELLTYAAYYYSPSLDVARAQWRIAKAAAISAGARPNPTVSIAPGFTANSPADVSRWLMGAGFDWPVETGGKRGLRVAQAKQLFTAAHFNLVAAAWQVRGNLRDSLAEYYYAELQSITLGQKIGLQKDIVYKLEERLKAGAISQTELLPERVALSKLQAELAASQASEATARSQVATAIGISPAALTNLPVDRVYFYTPQLSAKQIAAARTRALHNRSDLLAALAEYDASETALHLEIARQYPDLHFGPNYEYDQGANKWRLGVSLDLPVFNHNQGPIAEAKAKRDEAAAHFTELQAKLISEMDAAAQSFQQTRNAEFEFIPVSQTSIEHELAVKAQARAGEVDAVHLLRVEIARLDDEALHDEAGHRSEIAFGRLEDATQQLLEQRAEVIAPPPPENLETNPREKPRAAKMPTENSAPDPKFL